MVVCFRDNIGVVTVRLDDENTAGVAFDGAHAYFTDASGRDYKVSVTDIIMIGREE